MQNKKTALIITVGTRDVQIDLSVLKEKLADKYEEVVNPKNNSLIARKAGELIRKYYDMLKSHIEIPIIQPTLKYLTYEAENIDHILLIATDQETPNNGDTCHYAEIIKTYITNHYKNVSSIEIFKITSNEVIYLDKMYNYFQGVFESNKRFKELNHYENIYLHLVGGIDAVNTGIRFNAIQKLGSKIKSELHVNENTGTATPIQAVKQFLQSNDVNTAKKMIENYLYEGISTLNFVSDDVKYFAQYAHYRMMFDFDKAVHILSKVSNHSIKDALLKELNSIRNPSNYQLKLQELFWNIDIKYRQKNYVDFLLRFFRLIEEILVQEVITVTKIPYTQNNWDSVFSQYLKNKPELEKWLDDEKLEYTGKNPSTHLLKRLLSYCKDEEQAYSQTDYDCIEKAYLLQQMRNKSIGAHSFDPPDEKEIKRIYEEGGVAAWLKQKTGILPDEKNPYDRINETILNVLLHK